MGVRYLVILEYAVAISLCVYGRSVSSTSGFMQSSYLCVQYMGVWYPVVSELSSSNLSLYMGVRYPVVPELSGCNISVYMGARFPVLSEFSDSNICVYIDVWKKELMKFSCSNSSVTFFHIKPHLSGDFCTKLTRDIFCYFLAVIFQELCSTLNSSTISYKPRPKQDILLLE